MKYLEITLHDNDFCVNIVDQDEIQCDCDSKVLYVPICTPEDLEHGISWFIV